MEWSRLGNITKAEPEGPLHRRRRGSIYSQTPSSRCSSSWGRTWLERRRRQDRVSNSVTTSDAAIFGARRRRRVHLCTRRGRRDHLWPTRVKADAGMMWPTRASLTRAIGRRAYDVADASIFLDARKEADAGIPWTRA